MATLWNKGTAATDVVDRFTVGDDRHLDMRLARYDIEGSKAHIRMLESIGLLAKDELQVLLKELDAIADAVKAGKFVVEDDVEDIHSQVELMLTRALGDMGKKIHAGRSRNDQVLVDIKLFLRDELQQVREETLALFRTLQALSEQHKEVLLPGYTHGQLAMPSSFGLWFGAYAEVLCDDMQQLGAAYRVVNRNPLGSAAGYGNSFPLDRAMTSSLLGFDTPVYNSVAAQLGRGKCELAVASALGSIALTLNKFAADCALYMSPNFGFIHFPDELTTGSSIMPHKKNPDVWEIVRARCNQILSCPNEIALLCSNLPHGYHRDLQLLKDILFPALERMHACLQMTDYMLQHIEVNTRIFEDPRYEHLFTVEEVNRRTLAGTPFRDAYKQVGIEVNEGRFHYSGPAPADMKASDLGHTHLGSLGNLCNGQIAALMEKAAAW
ncbi:MAG: argininosuccinate lyase [Bacteroidales bacterium]|nr:argininosuccinate lyase [Bacteroidales bacterium]